MRVTTNSQISLFWANHSPWIKRGFKTILSIFMMGITGTAYLLFESTRDSFYAIIGISSLGIGLWILLREYPILRKYEAIILPFVSGLFIFLLFMEQGLDTVVLDSEIAYLQIRTSVIISTNLLIYLYALSFLTGSLFIVPLCRNIIRKKDVGVEISLLFAFIGSLLVVFSSWNLLQGEMGMTYRYDVRESTQPKETLLYNPLELLFSNFHILLLITGVILIILRTLALNNEKETDQKLAISLTTGGTLFIFISLLNLLQGIKGITTNFLNPTLGIVYFPPGRALTTPPSVLIDARCSGIHSFTIFITCFYLTFLYIGRHAEKKRLAIALTIGTFGTLTCNWIRLSLIYLIGYYYGNEPMQQAHDYAGLVVFLTWMIIFWIYALDYLKLRNDVVTEEMSEVTT